MTVGVAALATFGKPKPELPNVVVIAVDRMLTTRETIEYQQRDQTKTYRFTDHVAAIVSGSIDSLFIPLQTTYLLVHSLGITTVSEIAETFAENFHQQRTKEVEEKHFRKYHLKVPEFISRQAEFPLSFREKMLKAIDDEDCNLGEVIIAGVDNNAAHIFSVMDPGRTYRWDVTGFRAIGVGEELAEGTFVDSMYTGNRDWLESVILTFFAKKRAEAASGVGDATDLYYISDQGTFYYAPHSPTVEALTQRYWERREQEEAAIVEDAGLFRNRLAVQQGTQDVRPVAGEEYGKEKGSGK